MLKYFFLGFGFLIVLIVGMAGFRGMHFSRPPIEIFPDMDHQPKKKAQTSSSFFADGRSAREPVAGTVPLGYAMPQQKPVDGSMGEMQGPYEQIHFTASPEYSATGRMGNQWGTGIPFEVTATTMARGQERYTISCSVCHGATGAGNGFAKQLGLATVQSLLQQRIRDMADGEIFNTITHGKNTMLGYGGNIQVQDRWAIIAYLRALQRSQETSTADVPEAELAKLQSTP